MPEKRKELTQEEQEKMDDASYFQANEDLKKKQGAAAKAPVAAVVVAAKVKPSELSTLNLVSYNLENKYMKQVVNYFNGDRQSAMRFMTGAVDYVRRVPKLQECTPVSLINSLMLVASFRFIPSSVGGEAYIIPYAANATFQIGYKGYVTLFYRAGIKKITSGIIYEHDQYSMVDDELSHTVDLTKSKEERGKPIGAYVRAILPSGEPIVKFMNATDILNHAKRFSKSFSKPDSPWNSNNDPELNMWKKTVLIQLSNVMPKNSELVRAMEEDFGDSVIADKRLNEAKDESKTLSMGNFLNNESQKAEEGADAPHKDDTTESIQVGDQD